MVVNCQSQEIKNVTSKWSWDKSKAEIGCNIGRESIKIKNMAFIIQMKNHPEIQHLNGGSQLAVVSCKGIFLP